VAWPAANLAIYVPFAIPFQFNVRRVFWVNGSNLTGNADLGVYTRTGARLFSTGATARSGASVTQYTTLGTPLLLSPGDYYMALSATTSATGSFIRFAPASSPTFASSGRCSRLPRTRCPQPRRTRRSDSPTGRYSVLAVSGPGSEVGVSLGQLAVASLSRKIDAGV
jgi:hypothetical protein